MQPDQIATIIGQLGAAAIFIFAWFRSEGQRDKERAEATLRYDEIQKEYHNAQTAHRSEMMQLLKDIVSDPYAGEKVRFPKIE